MEAETDLRVRCTRPVPGALTFAERISRAVAVADSFPTFFEASAFTTEHDSIEVHRDVSRLTSKNVAQLLGYACFAGLVLMPLVLSFFVLVLTSN